VCRIGLCHVALSGAPDVRSVLSHGLTGSHGPRDLRPCAGLWPQYTVRVMTERHRCGLLFLEWPLDPSVVKRTSDRRSSS
jgi:hypothetical protein